MTGVAERALAEARLWIGTPYRHQGATRGAGADCLGLIRGVWRALYGREPEPVPAYTQDWAETGDTEVLMEAATRHMTSKRRDQAEPGDVILFRMREGSIAKHLGIRSVGLHGATVIHAYTGHGVVESPLSAPWQRRIVGCFGFPEESF